MIIFELTNGWKLKITGLHYYVNNQTVKTSRLLTLPVIADNMRPRDRGKPQERLAPRPKALPKPQISRPVRGVRPERHRSNATNTADAINNNLQLGNCFKWLVSCLDLAESIKMRVLYR